jgi:hypothetical protein
VEHQGDCDEQHDADNESALRLEPSHRAQTLLTRGRPPTVQRPQADPWVRAVIATPARLEGLSRSSVLRG